MTTYNSLMDESTDKSIANVIDFAINRRLMDVNTMLLCEVLAVNGTKLRVKSLLNYLDTKGNPIDPPIIYDVPTMMIVGGNAGVIIEYQIGDNVVVGFCQRDISGVKSTQNRQNPSTYRKFSLSDGIVLGKFSNILPTVYVKVTNNGVEIKGPDIKIISDGTATVQAQTANIEADEVNLGNNATANVLVKGIPFTATITNVQAGSDTVTSVITSSAGGSTTVKASV